MRNTLQRLYRTKLTLLATLFTFAGVVLLVIAREAEGATSWRWLADLPTADIGSALFTTGLIAIAFTYLDERDSEIRANQRLRKVLRQEAPAIRDAVIDGFAFAPDTLTKVAAPEVLDKVVENCLAIQLGDKSLAKDLYVDLREQVLRTAERHFDVHASVTLTPWEHATATKDMFVATIRWDYRTRLSTSTLRYSCVSNSEEYRQLLRDPTSAGVWFFRPTGGLDAGSPDAFQLVQFTIDGRPQTVRHTKRTTGQVFAVNLDAEATDAKAEVQLSCTYRVLVRKHGHLLYVDFAKPSKGVKVDLWYGDAGIRYVNVLDFIAGAQAARVQRSPASVPTPNVSIDYAGWVFPRSGVAFVWVLESEAPGPEA
jgi:hypothetical protein